MTCMRHYNIIFTDLKILYPLPIHLPHPIPGKHGSFYCLYGFAFYRIVGIIAFSDWLLSYWKMHFKFFHVFLWLDDSLLFSAE